MPFSIDGPLVIVDGTMRWYPRKPGTITEVHVALGISPVGGGVTVRVKKGSTSIGQTTLAPGSFTGFFNPATPYVLGDFFTVDVTAVGGSNPGGSLVVQIVSVFS